MRSACCCFNPSWEGHAFGSQPSKKQMGLTQWAGGAPELIPIQVTTAEGGYAWVVRLSVHPHLYPRCCSCMLHGISEQTYGCSSSLGQLLWEEYCKGAVTCTCLWRCSCGRCPPLLPVVTKCYFDTKELHFSPWHYSEQGQESRASSLK